MKTYNPRKLVKNFVDRRSEILERIQRRLIDKDLARTLDGVKFESNLTLTQVHGLLGITSAGYLRGSESPETRTRKAVKTQQARAVVA